MASRSLFFEAYFSLKLAVAALISYFLGVLISAYFSSIASSIGGLWCAFSSIIVMRLDRVETFKLGGIRVLGNLIGSLIGAFAIFFFKTEIWSLLPAVFLAALICFFWDLQKVLVPCCLATTIEVVIWHAFPYEHPWLFCASRFCEATAGVLVAFLVLHIPPFERGKSDFK